MDKHLKQRGDGIAEKRPSSPIRTDKTIMVKFSGGVSVGASDAEARDSLLNFPRVISSTNIHFKIMMYFVAAPIMPKSENGNP